MPRKVLKSIHVHKREEVKRMSDKSYYGKCGSCKYCELGYNYETFSGSMKFACEKVSGAFVYADEDPCGRYEPDRSRTNDMIAKYDR